MKTIWTILGTLMAASLIAQDNTNNLPAYPAPVNSPAAETAPAPAPAPSNMQEATAPATRPAKHIKKHRAMKKSKPAVKVKESKVTLAPGSAEVNASELVVRGQPGLQGEVITHLAKGDTVTVLDQIDLAKHIAGEPSQWAKISYPTNAHVWVNAKYVDTNGIVTTKKLNLRAGHGENYSVVGVIEQGTTVTQIETRGNWMEIQPPANAFAFVAAKYLTQEAAATQTAPTVPAPEAPEVAPTPTPVPAPEPIVTTPPPAPAPPQPTEPAVRIVEHEGIVGPVGSLIAPTDYKLYDLDTKQDIDFLYPTSPDMDFSKLVDAKVIVTGEEGIEARWPNTPVMAVQSVQIVSTNVIKRFNHLELTAPRQRH